MYCIVSPTSANISLDLEQTKFSNPGEMQLEAKVYLLLSTTLVMISSLDDGAVGQFISRAAFVLVRMTSSSSKLEDQPFMTFSSILSQNTSWSCLNVSLESFHNIVNFHNFSDNVYDVVQAFRCRRSDIQQFRWSACRALLSSPEGDRYGRSLAHLMFRRPLTYESRDLL